MIFSSITNWDAVKICANRTSAAPSTALPTSTLGPDAPSSAGVESELESPTTATPDMTMPREAHCASGSFRPRKRTEKSPTQSTRAPRSIWYTETGTKSSPTFISVVPQIWPHSVSNVLLARRGGESATHVEYRGKPHEQRP